MKKKKLQLILAAIVFCGIFGLAEISQAANRYVRQGATGNGSGSDWTNAYTALPAALTRGDTYYIADGSYPGYTFDDANAGTFVITIKKATVSDHGTETGWNNSYGDGQATFNGDFVMVTDYFTIDGQLRNENDWSQGSAYGFRIIGGFYTSSLAYGHASDYITVRYADIGGSDIGNTYSASNPDGFYIGGFGEVANNWTISHCRIHNVGIAFQCAGADSFTIEYNYIGPAWSKEAVRGQIRASNFIIRHNIMWNSCQVDPSQGSGSACTAEIAMWGATGSGLWDNNKIYGNIFQKTTNEVNTGGSIVIGGNGSSWVGSPANNTLIYSNTIVGIRGGTAMILINGGTGNVVRNNIWSGLGSGVGSGASANTTSNNSVVSTSAFLSYPNNLRLSGATIAGYSLPTPYNVDMLGNVRGQDGVWDIGAYEYDGTTLYSGPSSSGNGSGSDFNNLIALPNTTGFVRGKTYIIIDGSYGSRTLSTPNSGTTYITIRKASSANSSVIGYSATLHSNQAIFSGVDLKTGYWNIDGVTRTETTRMEAPAGYGIRASNIYVDGFGGDRATGSTFSYMDVGGTWSTASTPSCGSIVSNALYFVMQNNITFARSVFHNAGAPNGAIAMMHGADNIVFDHCDFYQGWGKATIAAPNVGINNLTVKYSRFWDSSRQDNWCGSSGSGITCEIGAYGNDLNPTNIQIYGNIFYGTASGGRNASIDFGGSGFTGSQTYNSVAYNNTFVGFPEDSVLAEIYYYAGSGNVVRNNLFYDTTGTVTVVANTQSNNIKVTSDPFVDYANRDFRLNGPTTSGYSVGSPYNIDFDGYVRGADGTYDLGAYEYAAGGSDTIPPVAPQGLAVS